MLQKLFLGFFIFGYLFLVNQTESQVRYTYKATNKTGLALTSVRFAKTETFQWGFELNIADKILNNATFEFQRKVDTTGCLYDFKLIDDSGKEYILEKVDLCGSTDIIITLPEEKENKPDPEIKTEEETKPDENNNTNPDMNTPEESKPM